MLSAVVQDLNRIPGVEVLSPLNAELFPTHHGPHFLPIDPAKEETIFRELAGKSDYTLVIAPELDDILATRCDWVEQAGGTLLGSSIAAIRLERRFELQFPGYSIPRREIHCFPPS